MDVIVQKDKHASKNFIMWLHSFIHALLDVRDPNKSEDGENARAFYGAGRGVQYLLLNYKACHFLAGCLKETGRSDGRLGICGQLIPDLVCIFFHCCICVCVQKKESEKEKKRGTSYPKENIVVVYSKFPV